ncbi:hypothetical protein GCM10009616_00700 [Microlunatus lacustris]
MAPQPKKSEVVDGFTIKYHANGVTRWSKGRIEDDNPVGYWEWYRPDGTLKRSGHFKDGEPVGEWVTYDQDGVAHKVTDRGPG